jgi:hypothetical protein
MPDAGAAWIRTRIAGSAIGPAARTGNGAFVVAIVDHGSTWCATRANRTTTFCSALVVAFVAAISAARPVAKYGLIQPAAGVGC